jgi:hypothetical protein
MELRKKRVMAAYYQHIKYIHKLKGNVKELENPTRDASGQPARYNLK